MGDTKIGTTGRGIGPAYEDKIARRALRVQDLFYPDRFAEKLERVLEYHNFVLTQYFKCSAVPFRQTLDATLAAAPAIAPMVADVAALLQAARRAGESLLFEGAQGALLDIDHGTYPYVTSSNCLAGAAASGAGIGPQMLDYVLGIVKAYTTRVGTGPFPTELTDEIGARLAKRGHRATTTLRLARHSSAYALIPVERRQWLVYHQARRARRPRIDQDLHGLSRCGSKRRAATDRRRGGRSL